MPTVHVDLKNVGASWVKPCQQAVKDLNNLFTRNGINVSLSTSGSGGTTITVTNDPSIQGSAVHGRTSAATDDAGRLLKADVRLPVQVTISTPGGIRPAGPGVLAVIAGHEFVHALGHEPHNSELMSQTWYKEAGDNAAGDKLKAGSAKQPPLTLSDDSITMLKSLWT